MKKKITVTVGYKYFNFDEDLQGAVAFADTAARTSVRDDDEVKLMIEYVEEEEDES